MKKKMGCGVVLAVILMLAGCSTGAYHGVKPTGDMECDRVGSFFANELHDYQGRVDETDEAYGREFWMVETADPLADTKVLSQLFEKYQKTAYDVGLRDKSRELAKAVEGNLPECCRYAAKAERGDASLQGRYHPFQSKRHRAGEKANQDHRDALAKIAIRFG